jgi:hypothetical protein
VTRTQRLALGSLTTVVVLAGTCDVRNRSWYRHAEAAIAHAAEIAGPGVTDSELVLRVPSEAVDAQRDRPRTIEVLTADNFQERAGELAALFADHAEREMRALRFI